MKLIDILTSFLLVISLCSASSRVSEFEVMPELQHVEVACVNVRGLEAFTEASCAQLTATVKQALAEFSELTGGVVGLPQQVRPRLLSGVIEVENVTATRCIDYAKATPAQRLPVSQMIHAAARAALEQVPLKADQTGLVVAVNGPLSLCREEPLPNATERCADTEARKGYLIGRTLDESLRLPAFFMFAAPDQPARELYITRHERGHLGLATARLGHDLGLCMLEGDWLPSRITRDETGLDVDIRAWETSVMGYSSNTTHPYIALPHLVHLGVIKEDRILTPRQSGVFDLGDVRRLEPAALRVELTNPAIKRVIIDDVSQTGLSVDDYALWIAKIPGSAEVGVYAAPMRSDQLRYADIFLLRRLGAGEYLDIEDGPRIEATGGGKDVVRVEVRLAR